MLRNYDVIVEVDHEVYEYGVTDKEISEFMDNLIFLDLVFNEYNVMKVGDVDVRVFPYFTICNDIIISISLD